MTILPETQKMKPIVGLEKRERIVWSGRPTRKGYIGEYIGTAIIGIFLTLLLFGTLLFLGWGLVAFFVLVFLILAVGISVLLIEIQIRALKYFITNKRFIKEFTFLSRHGEALPIDLVTDINFQQGILQRTVNCGNIFIITAGTPTGFRAGARPGLRFSAIHNPIDVTKIASKVRTKRKR